MIDAGKTLIGKTRYVFGGGRSQSDINAGRFDCSSFVRWAFEQVGMNVGPMSGVTTDTPQNTRASNQSKRHEAWGCGVF